MGFPFGSVAKESACNAGDLVSIPGLGRSPEEGNGYPLQYSGLENSMDCIVHGVSKSRTRLSDFHFHFGYQHSKLLLQVLEIQKWLKDKIPFPVECTFKSGETENIHKIKFKIFICDIKVTKQSEGIRNVVRHYFK